MNDWHQIFIDRLAELKKAEGMTQAKLAEALDLSQGAIASWIKGTHEPRNVRQFRSLEKALRLPTGALTQPAPQTRVEETRSVYLASDNSTPYQPSIDTAIAEKATAFLMDELGADGMKKAGAKWCAETIVMLYDLFSDPASDQLSHNTILKMIKKQ